MMDKEFIAVSYPAINLNDNREQIIQTVESAVNSSEIALLSLYAYRDMRHTEWEPFIKAAIERNPVCHQSFAGKNANYVYTVVNAFENESIYDPDRLAQPDEVWNFRRGDGIEKAILMADALISVNPTAEIEIEIYDEKVELKYNNKSYSFISNKDFRKKITIKSGRVYQCTTSSLMVEAFQ